MRHYVIMGLALSAFCLAVSCSEEFMAGTVDENPYKEALDVKAYICDKDGLASFGTVEVADETVTAAFDVKLTRPVSADTRVSLSISDGNAVAAYNAEHGTSYALYPDGLASISGNGLSIAAGELVSGTSATVTVEPLSDGLSAGDYVIPVQVEADGENVRDGDIFMLFVKDMKGRKIESAAKPSGIKLFSCMEVGTANPLLHLSFMLKNSGKPLYDCVILFSGNVVYDTDRQRVCFRPSKGIEAIISDYDKYIKPLHDMGIKVIFSMVNTDNEDNPAENADFKNLSEETCRYFAREIADFCQAYRLDGVFFDDEYGGDNPRPGFGNAGPSRLIYETKKALPEDCWVVTYLYKQLGSSGGDLRKLETVDGVSPGDYVDYALNDYGAKVKAYDGMDKSQWGALSTNWAPGFKKLCATEENLRYVRENCGAYMAYCLDFSLNTWNDQLAEMKRIARFLYDDELVDLEYRPKAEW